MADTYTVAALGVAFAANKQMIALFNGSGSGKIYRVYRMWALNNQVTAVTGVMTNLQIQRLTNYSGGIVLTPIKHDSQNPALASQFVCSSGGGGTLGDIFRRVLWSTDEPAAGTASNNDELQTVPVWNQIWDVGYNETNVEPLVLREGYGVAIVNTSATIGSADFFAEFTQSNT